MTRTIRMKDITGLKANTTTAPFVTTQKLLNTGVRGIRNPPPGLRFSDIIHGPKTGLGDGLGEGAIVTVWGHGLAGTTRQFYFTDSLDVKRPVAHTYYLKRADGVAPSGPANLWESHQLWEAAVSIPAASADGLGTITAEVDGVASVGVSFTVQAGNIYWVAPTGVNSNPGTFASPKAYVNADISPSSGNGGIGNGGMVAGDICYSRSVAEPDFNSGGRYAGMYLRSLEGVQGNQIAIVAYPGEHSVIQSQQAGVRPYLSSAIAVSKYKIMVGNKPESDTTINPGNSAQSDTHIYCTDYGRAVGTYLIENPGTVFNGWSGSVSGGGSDFAMIGNQCFDLGDDQTSHFQHTTYFTLRNPAASRTAYEVRFNYLKDCKAKYGIHIYDQSYADGCGILTGTMVVRHNVIVNQKGSGININTRDLSSVDGICWSTDLDVCGNLLINCGLGPQAEANNGSAPQALTVGGDINAQNAWVDSNTIYGVSDESGRLHGNPFCVSVNFDTSKVNPAKHFTNNLLVNDFDMPWFHSSTTFDTDTNNIYWNSAGTTEAVTPVTGTEVDPLLARLNAYMIVDPTSPIQNAGANKRVEFNIYGETNQNIGAI